VIESTDELRYSGRDVSSLTSRAGLRALAVDALHLFVLSAFAFGQPLLRILGNGAEFFVARDAGPSDVVMTALEIVLVPPAILLGAELAVQAVLGRWARRAIHVLFVGALIALVTLPALRQVGALASVRALVAVAAAIGALGAFAYARARPVRAVVTYLTPAPLLFLAIFLLASPATRLVFPGSARAASRSAAGRVPVVFVVFDEFSGTSLLDGRGSIDAARFPNFAALARSSLWFKNALTSALATERAVPALLTGKDSRPGSLAVLQDHPENLFTLLGGSHDLDVHETETHLCPPHLCSDAANTLGTSGASGLASDLAIVYGRFALPPSLADRLPSISTRWGNFRAQRGAGATETQAPVFERFLAGLGQSPSPALHFVHVELPHVPWHYLPSGREYAAPDDIPGLDDELWAPEPWLVLQAQQRYLLQVGYVDRLLGKLVGKLKSSGLYDRALIVVTADHGVSFHAGEGRRTTTQHPADLAFVPLFVKLPHERRGRTVEQPVQTTGVIPAVADVLHIRLPWRADGRSILRAQRLRRVRIDNRSFGVPALLAARDADLASQSRLFGPSRLWRGVFSAGAPRGLIGTLVEALHVLPAGQVRAHVTDGYHFGAVRPSAAVVPVYVSGRMAGPGASRSRELALALNGRIAAVSRSYSWHGTPSFSFLVAETALRRGRNEVRVYGLLRPAGVSVLQPLGGA
jgi:hypothetical protein